MATQQLWPEEEKKWNLRMETTKGSETAISAFVSQK